MHATVSVGDRVLNRVKAALFGDNLEWIEAAGGIYLPEEDAFDPHIIREIKDLGVTHLRFPGGILSDFYDWRTAVGDARQPQPNPFSDYLDWRDRALAEDGPGSEPFPTPRTARNEHPAFGPDEFVRLCNELNVAATVTLNAGTGSPQDAAWTVDYCRRKGLNVASYAVGNEINFANPELPSLPVRKTPEQYVAFFEACLESVRAVAPGTLLGAIATLDTGMFALNNDTYWMEMVAEKLHGKLAFLDLHNSYAPVSRSSIHGDTSDDEFVECFLGASEYVRSNFAATKTLLDEVCPPSATPTDFHVTEYGPLLFPPSKTKEAVLDELSWNRTLAAALYQASLFHVYFTEPRLVSASHFPLVHFAFAPLVEFDAKERPPRNTWRSIVGHVFSLYRNMTDREVLDVQVSCSTYAAKSHGIVPDLTGIPYLDVLACRTADRHRLALFLINRHLTESIEARIDCGFNCSTLDSAETLSAESYRAANTVDSRDLVRPRVGQPGGVRTDGTITLDIPKHSLTRVEIVR